MELQGDRRYTPLDETLLMLSRALLFVPSQETVSVRKAFGRILAADVRARDDSPKRDVSHFDGYAVVSADTASATAGSPMALDLKRGVDRLDHFPRGALKPGEAMAIATGGYLPMGADAVIPLEDASERGGKVWIRRPVGKGERVYRAGADVRRGEIVLEAGKALMGQDQVLLASLHFGRVRVMRKPRVAILPTGSELTSDISDRTSGKVVESHSLLLERLVEGAGGEAATLRIVPDDAAALSKALRGALRGHDIVLTLAGSSIGEPDLVDSAIRGFGRATTVLVHGISVNRGRVMGCAVVAGKPIVLLPGPIQGALNAFIVLAYPLIRLKLGKGMQQPPAVSATVGEAWEATGKFKDFDQVVYLKLARSPRPNELVATPSGAETEKVSFLVSKNAYAIVSGKNPRLSKGEVISAHLLPGFSALD